MTRARADLADVAALRRATGAPLDLAAEAVPYVLPASDGNGTAPTTDVADSRPMIYVTADYGLEVVPRAWAALKAANEPPRYFRRGGVIVEMVKTEEGTPAPRIVGQFRMRGILGQVAAWVRPGEKDEPQEARPPLDVAQTLTADPEPDLPILSRVVRGPILAASGRIVAAPAFGYDSETRAWLDLRGLDLPNIPDHPDRKDIEAARDLLLNDFLGDFPFVAAPDRANALALLLLPFVRERIEGPTPLHLVEKPSPGSGGGLLVQVIGIVVTGREPPATTEGRDEEEWRKRLTSILRGAPEIVWIDNLRRRLDSGAVSAALTATTWKDRILGKSEDAELPVRAAWIAVGNNPAVSAEIARRCVCIRLDPKTDRPWLREPGGFRHSQLLAWTKTNRGRLVAACLTLARAWLVAGAPTGRTSLGSFESWAGTIGGILGVAGIEGFLENRERFYARADRESAAWVEFLSAWWTAHADAPVGVKDLADLDPLPVDLGRGSERSQRTRLGEAIAAAVDRRYVIDGRQLVIEAAGERQRAKLYILTETCPKAPVKK